MTPPPAAQIGSRRLSAADPAILVALTGPGDPALDAQAHEARAAGADIVEWRADLWSGREDAGSPDGWDPVRVARRAARLRELLAPVPLLLTVRTASEGGAAPDRVDLPAIAEAAIGAGACDALDVEIAHPGAPAAIAAARDAGLPVVASFHAVSGTPALPEMLARLTEMEDAGAQIAKLAVMAHGPADEAQLLHATAVRARESRIPLLTMAMGAAGLVSRLVGHRYGSCGTFALASAASAASAPGQVDIERVRAAWSLVPAGADT